MKKYSLYDLTSDFAALMDAEGDEEITNALIEISAGEIERKAESICHFLAAVEGDIESFKAEEKRISASRKVMENKVTAVRERMKDCLVAANIDRVQAGTFKVSIAATGGSVSIDNESDIPARFMTVIPEQFVPNKIEILRALRAGEIIPGSSLKSGCSLRIK